MTSTTRIARTRLISSTVRSAGYDAASATLEIEFTSGAVYRYLRVPIAVYQGLLAAPSHGTFFNADIKPRFVFVKVTDQPPTRWGRLE